MSRCSSYQQPENWMNRGSGSYYYVAQKCDGKFSYQIMILSVILFTINLLLSGLWMGLTFGVWTNWDKKEFQKFMPERESCNLAKFFAEAKSLEAKPPDDSGSFSKVIWNHDQPGPDLDIQERGFYAVSSTLTFLCKGGQRFSHFLKTSRGDEIKEEMEINLADDEQREYYSSFLYAVFELDKGDSIFVQTGPSSTIKYNSSYVSYFRIRNHLRCPRKIILPHITKSMVKELGKLKDDERFYGQKIFKDAYHWWHDGYISKTSCSDSCENNRFEGKEY